MDTIGEYDMAAINGAFDTARNAIIDTLIGPNSQIQREITELRSNLRGMQDTVEELRASVRHWQERNATLDEHLIHARRQRDDATTALDNAKHENEELKGRVENLTREAERLRDDVASGNHRISDLSSERDDAQLRVMELEDENRKLKERLTNIQNILSPPGQVTPRVEDDPPQPRDPVTGKWLEKPEGGQVGGQVSQPQPDHYESPTPRAANEWPY